MEMSARGSDEITRAGTGSSPRNSTVMSSIVCTTCAAVATLPSREISTPEPISRKRVIPSAVTSWPFDRITTTAGLTRRNASPSVSPIAGHGAAIRSTSAATPTPRLVLITASTRESLGPAVQEVERLHERRRRRVGPEPPLVDRHDSVRAIERRERPVHVCLERVVAPSHHQRIGLVREKLA